MFAASVAPARRAVVAASDRHASRDTPLTVSAYCFSIGRTMRRSTDATTEAEVEVEARYG